MNCNKILYNLYNGKIRKRYLKHIKHCQSCRYSVRLMNKIASNIKQIDMPILDNKFNIRVKQQLEKQNQPYFKNFPFYRWLVAGLAIIFSIVIIKFANVFTENLPSEIDNLIQLTLGILLTVIIMLFASCFYKQFRITYFKVYSRIKSLIAKRFFSSNKI